MVGAAGGLAAAPLVHDRQLALSVLLSVGALITLVLFGGRLRRSATLLASAAVLAGLLVGNWRLDSIDAGAYSGCLDGRTTLRGHVLAVRRPLREIERIVLSTDSGRLQVETADPTAGLRVGREVVAAGVLRRPSPSAAPHLRRAGIRCVLAVARIAPTGRRRGGLPGLVDSVRDRAEAALERAMPREEAALARGMVLGEDDRVDETTVERFRRSGLAHILAVSGQNILLLAMLSAPLLALCGLGLRGRLIGVLFLIALYVPLTGGAPSIQRAAVMGAAGVAATLAGRPSSRWYALGLGAAVTLALNPRATGDAGWQLSFAAVIGITLWARPLAGRIRRRLGPGSWQQVAAEGIAMSVAATLATAPLMAYDFERISLTSLAANLAALPAVAPAMWLGMVVAALGQLRGVPVEPFNWLNSLLIAAIAQIAAWFGDPRWAVVEVRLPGVLALAGTYAVGGGAWLILRSVAARLRGLSLEWRAPGPRSGPRSRKGLVLALSLALVLVLALVALPVVPGSGGSDPPPGLMVRVLDVGQGDSILLDPADGDPVLVDGGPPDGRLRQRLEELGVRRLAAAVATHDQADHAGGLRELLGSMPIGAVVHAVPSPSLGRRVRAAGARWARVAAGDRLASGSLRLRVLWPPVAAVGGGGEGDPNLRALVMVAEWRGFRMLLAGDAEAEAADARWGPVDVLKVAHHGSSDAGLESLLAETRPRLALISVGSDNPYGHPAPVTLDALREAHVRVLRTDRNGSISVRVGESGWTVAAER